MSDEKQRPDPEQVPDPQDQAENRAHRDSERDRPSRAQISDQQAVDKAGEYQGGPSG
jgi:hypothetical protein